MTHPAQSVHAVASPLPPPFWHQRSFLYRIKLLAAWLIILPVLLLGGCETFGFRNQSRNQATSIVAYLYPNEKEHIDTPGPAKLSLPLRVGVVFVPPARAANAYAVPPITETGKADLLKRVAAEFRGLPYVKDIEIIPTTYLLPGGGFRNLDQVREMFDVDVIALVAYDQAQFTSEGLLSLTYWTIVGAYIVPGEKNDTETLMEAVVYDVKSRKMLFRAPGMSHIHANATPVNLSGQLRLDSGQGFADATTELIANLKSELEEFKTRVKDSPADFQIEHQPGYTGGGALDGGFAAAIVALALTRLRWKIRK